MAALNILQNNNHIHIDNDIYNIMNNINNIHYNFNDNDLDAIINFPNANYNQEFYINLINTILNHIKNNNIDNIQLHNIDNINVLNFINNNHINDNAEGNHNIMDVDDDFHIDDNIEVADDNIEVVDDIQPNPVDDDVYLHIIHEDVCSICLDTMDMGNECVVTPCEHYFHSGCIQPWLLEHNSCPLCRQNIE
jgi:hypothetical protein